MLNSNFAAVNLNEQKTQPLKIIDEICFRSVPGDCTQQKISRS